MRSMARQMLKASDKVSRSTNSDRFRAQNPTSLGVKLKWKVRSEKISSMWKPLSMLYMLREMSMRL